MISEAGKIGKRKLRGLMRSHRRRGVSVLVFPDLDLISALPYRSKVGFVLDVCQLHWFLTLFD